MDLMVTVSLDMDDPESGLDVFAAALPAASGAAYALGDRWMDVTLTAMSIDAGRALCARAASAAGLPWTVRKVIAEPHVAHRG
ncbi:hypothetical protein [Nocardioides antri]|uniref:Uncharacterized protein n=1 Tax=Nocardioides antri TaxID=2607659 RepID=A0A5B1M842_9ACTN|nr:hypothetical protein [Nocardioides antri]KAA1427860.1 hypothetical protein F0U47_10595 [Nocardioides antri]